MHPCSWWTKHRPENEKDHQTNLVYMLFNSLMYYIFLSVEWWKHFLFVPKKFYDSLNYAIILSKHKKHRLTAVRLHKHLIELINLMFIIVICINTNLMNLYVHHVCKKNFLSGQGTVKQIIISYKLALGNPPSQHCIQSSNVSRYNDLSQSSAMLPTGI